MSRTVDGLVLSLGTFTRLPVTARRTDRPAVAVAMASAPLVGAALGCVAAGVAALARWPLPAHAGAVLPAALAVLALALLTGALHLDGLADTADALGVRGDASAARAAMKSPGVGAFGVTAVVLVLLVDVAAVTTASARGVGWTVLVAGTAAGRLAAALACRRGVSAATGEGSGAWVAETVTAPAAAVAVTLTVGVAVAVGLWDGGLVAALLSVVTAAAVGEIVLRIGTTRVGGLTGDVIGAVTTCAATASYVVTALAGPALR